MLAGSGCAAKLPGYNTAGAAQETKALPHVAISLAPQEGTRLAPVKMHTRVGRKTLILSKGSSYMQESPAYPAPVPGDNCADT